MIFCRHYHGAHGEQMQITFVGVGEACDPDFGNTSLVVHAGNGRHFLLDCGFTVPHAYFRLCSDPEALAGIWVSHFHGDHFFGLPLLILKLDELGRRSPLSIIGQKSIKKRVTSLINEAYGSLIDAAGYSIVYRELEPGFEMELENTRWRCAQNEHSRRSLSLRLDAGGSVFYSGDGRPTKQTRELAAGSDLIVHEAYTVHENQPGHSSISSCIDFAQGAGAASLALVHISAGTRAQAVRELARKKEQRQGLHVFIPEPGKTYDIL